MQFNVTKTIRTIFLAFSILSVNFLADTSLAAAEVTSLVDEYRLFCGYLDVKEDRKYLKLSEKKRLKKIARLAKTSAKNLELAIKTMTKYGESCEEVSLYFKNKVEEQLPKSLRKRIDVFRFDAEDPSHVLVSLRFKGIDNRKVVEEASLLSQTISIASPIVKTIAIRAVNPRVKDPSSFDAMWFEARIEGKRASRIIQEKIKDYANRRYIRLFDSVRCGHDLMTDKVLAYRRGPCVGKEAVRPAK